MKRMVGRILLIWVTLMSLMTSLLYGENIYLQLEGKKEVPGKLICQVFGSEETFRNLSDPILTQYVSQDSLSTKNQLSVDPGLYAIMVFLDLNDNQELDRNFIGIPKEPVWFSNNYRPKGPPVFLKASFRIDKNPSSQKTITVPLNQLRKTGRKWGVGSGLLTTMSPYRGSRSRTMFIPSVVYLGDRIQVLGPEVSIGVFKKERTTFSALCRLQPGAYDESDSSFLQGLGDRRLTVMTGSGLDYRWFGGITFKMAYLYDITAVHHGSISSVKLQKTFNGDNWRLTPYFGGEYVSPSLAMYEYGVSSDAIGRSYYRPGGATILSSGAMVMIDLPMNWSMIGGVRVNRLGSDLSNSPIVGRSTLVSSMVIVSYLF